MIQFGRTQRAIQTPFEPGRNPGFGGNPQTFVSTDVQNAIEEAKATAFLNDRYSFIASYGGNANVGRYLEMFPSIDSLSGPFIIPEASRLITLVLACVSNSTFTVGLFKTTDLVTPIASFSITAATRQVYTGLSYAIAPLDQLCMRVTAGSANKPYAAFWLQTTGT